jgi:hypothetical protein
MSYLWQRPSCPEWKFDVQRLANMLIEARLQQGRVIGKATRYYIDLAWCAAQRSA